MLDREANGRLNGKHQLDKTELHLFCLRDSSPATAPAPPHLLRNWSSCSDVSLQSPVVLGDRRRFPVGNEHRDAIPADFSVPSLPPCSSPPLEEEEEHPYCTSNISSSSPASAPPSSYRCSR
eukprot:763670-Hanusia_phi.AAC.4